MLDDNDSTPTLGDESSADGLAPQPGDATNDLTGEAASDATAPAPDAPPSDSGAAEAAPAETLPGSPDPSPGADAAGASAGEPRVAKKAARKRASRPRKTAAPAPSAEGGAPDETPGELTAQPSAEAGLEQLPTPGEEPGQSPAPSVDAADSTAAPAKRAAKRAPAKRTATRKSAARKTAARTADATGAASADDNTDDPADASAAADAAGADSATTGTDIGADADSAATGTDSGADAETDGTAADGADPAESFPEPAPAAPMAATSLLFQAPDPVVPPRRRPRRSAAVVVPGPERKAGPAATDAADESDESDDEPTTDVADTVDAPAASADPVADTRPDGDADADVDVDVDADADSDSDGDSEDSASGDEQGTRRRRRRGGRRRRRGAGDGDDSSEGADSGDAGEPATDQPTDDQADSSSGTSGGGGGKDRDGGRGRGQRDSQRSGPADDTESQDEGTGSRRRRRRRRTGEDEGGSDEPGTAVRVRKPRNAEDEITSLHGSTRLEAKKQRRREGREAGRRRAPIVSEAEFLARREAVERVMVIRQRQDLTQIAVLEDKVLVEHYVARESQTSLIGNVYLGRVQNVLPSMEAAFIDIGKGRNAVLYAGEVNWDALGAGNGPRKIEAVLKSGQPILVQVSKDPIGHKGARLTSQVSLPGRFLVYVPDGTTSGISRKLPDTERSRLKTLLKEIVPDSAGVIVRTAAEGASEEELTLDVERLTARWADIEAKIAKGNAPQLLYGEPDLTLKVVRDLFTEDFAQLVISGDEAWDTVDGYVKHVAPDLEERLEKYDGEQDVFAAYRVDEQIAKGLDRKVWLPSGGSLVIDRTEAMTVVDVNTGKFTGSGGNLEETVTKNNLEAAEEIVRQLRLRDIGGIIVVDFIDMVLESNRDLVLRRLVECLGRDRTRHQVAEVTSLGLVQMTRKRIGTGLLESFSENCDHCQGRGVVIQHEPVEPRKQPDEEPRRGGRRGRGRGDGDAGPTPAPAPKGVPSPKDIAAMARHEPKHLVTDGSTDAAPADPDTSSVPDVSGDAPSTLPQPGDGGSTGSAAATPYASDGPSTGSPAAEVPDASGDAPTETPEVAPTGQGDASALGEEVAAPSLAGPQVTSPPTDTEVAAGPGEPGSETALVDVPQSDELPVAPEPAPLSVGAAGLQVDAPSGGPVAAPRPVGGSADQPGGPAEAEQQTTEQPATSPVAAGPRLVTSTRRRVARRPAGPPAAPTTAAVSGTASGGAGTLVEDPTGDPSGDPAGPDGDGTVIDAPHVPVKKRGRRR